MTVAIQRMFGILERWNNNLITPSLSKPHELSYRSNNFLSLFIFSYKKNPECIRENFVIRAPLCKDQCEKLISEPHIFKVQAFIAQFKNFPGR